jgi:thiamine monophosphate kinase
VLGQRSRPQPPPLGYKHLSPEQRAKLDAALAATAQSAAADAAEGVRTEVQQCLTLNIGVVWKHGQSPSAASWLCVPQIF